VDGAAAGRDAGLGGDPRATGAQQRQEPSGEGEVAEVVGAELQLVAVDRRLSLGRRHHAGVVDQQVDRHGLVDQLAGELGDRREGRQVQVAQAETGVRHGRADRGDGGLALRAVADRHQHLGTCSGERGCHAEPHPVAGTGDDGAPAGQVGEGEVVLPGSHVAAPVIAVSGGCHQRAGGREPYPRPGDPWIRTEVAVRMGA
jgi:hypothetical protein